jgi:16S rRNA (guanine966-N2)-methyltransferase
MRVIAGIARGRRLLSVPGDSTRPIMDRVKTALFNILQPYLEESDFLDLFAGTGAVGIEALSRGARSAVFIDLNRKAWQTIQSNLENTELNNAAEVRNTDVFSYVRNTSKSFDIIYCDPPQFKNLWVEAIQTIAERPEILKPNGIIIIKIHPKEYEKLELLSLHEFDQRKYGNSTLIFLKRIA